MDSDRLDSYLTAATILEAREALVQLEIAGYPYAKQEERQKIHRKYHELAFPKVHREGEQKVVTTDELARILNGAMNG